jgi:hypothetical protein
MFFNRSYHFTSSQSADAIRQKLLGRHTSVHGLDFEIIETDRGVRVVPHAEQVEAVKTLPVTRVELNGQGGQQTKVSLFAHMRRIDQGGPLLIVIFSLFMIIAGVIGYLYGQEEYSLYTLPLIGIGLVVFIIMWVRLETGYFDYVRKVRDFVKAQAQ